MDNRPAFQGDFFIRFNDILYIHTPTTIVYTIIRGFFIRWEGRDAKFLLNLDGAIYRKKTFIFETWH
jgi:hypothetical protein